MSNDGPDTKTLEAAAAWDAIARMHGYNEMTKLAKTLGEKAYCRLACDVACEEAMKLGAEIARTEMGGQVIFSINEVSPSIKFRESDIDGMREAVRVFDGREDGRASVLREALDAIPQDICPHGGCNDPTCPLTRVNIAVSGLLEKKTGA